MDRTELVERLEELKEGTEPAGSTRMPSEYFWKF